MLDLSFIANYMLLVPHARPLQRGDLVLRVLKGLSSDPREVQTHLEQILHYQRVDLSGSYMVDGFDGNQFLEPTNVDQLKKF